MSYSTKLIFTLKCCIYTLAILKQPYESCTALERLIANRRTATLIGNCTKNIFCNSIACGFTEGYTIVNFITCSYPISVRVRWIIGQNVLLDTIVLSTTSVQFRPPLSTTVMKIAMQENKKGVVLFGVSCKITKCSG